MKYFIILLTSCLVGSALSAQYIYTIKADSVKITNNCDTAELILENHTQNVLGFLYNKGRGRTEFRKIIKLDDSTLVFGDDTVVIRGIGIDELEANNGLMRVGKTIQLGQPFFDSESGEPAGFNSDRIIPVGEYTLKLHALGLDYVSLSSHNIEFADATKHAILSASQFEFSDEGQVAKGGSAEGEAFIEVSDNGNDTKLKYSNADLRVHGNAFGEVYPGISIIDNGIGNKLRLQRNTDNSFISNDGLDGSLYIFDSGNFGIAGNSAPADNGAKFQVTGTGTFSDTLTATTMGNSDSSNRVATTAFVKRVMPATPPAFNALYQSVSSSTSTNQTKVSSANVVVYACNVSAGSMDLIIGTSTVGQLISIKKTDPSANAINIYDTNYNGIDGKSPLVINTRYESVTLAWDGNNYIIVSYYDGTSL